MPTLLILDASWRGLGRWTDYICIPPNAPDPNLQGSVMKGVLGSPAFISPWRKQLGQALVASPHPQNSLAAYRSAPESFLLQPRKHPWGHFALFQHTPYWLLGLAGPLSNVLHPFLKRPRISVFEG